MLRSAVRVCVTPALIFAVVAACGSKEETRKRSPVEQSIEATLNARFGTAVVTRCFDLAPVCEARLTDGSSLPISVIRRKGEWEWHVIGLVVTSDELESYLRDEVADLGAPQGVGCAPRVRRISAGDRIECSLAGGGKGFFTVREDGSVSVEVVLDASSANARSEIVTPERDAELTRSSKALAYSEEMGEDVGTIDAGTPDAGTPDAGELHLPAAPRGSPPR